MSAVPGRSAETPLAIFPLSTVLFPGGVLPLRIFEVRYMDMVRECMKHGTPFGVCRITHGSEAGVPAEHEAIGCLATISHWDMEQLGLLHIRTVGTQRFRVLDERLGENALVRANIELIDDDPPAELPDDFEPCVDIVRKLVERIARDEPETCKRAVAEPYVFDSASWVGNRLCEFLPLDGGVKQKLMELDDPLERLRQVHCILQQRNIL